MTDEKTKNRDFTKPDLSPVLPAIEEFINNGGLDVGEKANDALKLFMTFIRLQQLARPDDMSLQSVLRDFIMCQHTFEETMKHFRWVAREMKKKESNAVHGVPV